MYKQIKNLLLCAGLATGLMLGLVGNATAAKKEAAPAAVEAPAATAAPVAAPTAVAPVAAPALTERSADSVGFKTTTDESSPWRAK